MAAKMPCLAMYSRRVSSSAWLNTRRAVNEHHRLAEAVPRPDDGDHLFVALRRGKRQLDLTLHDHVETVQQSAPLNRICPLLSPTSRATAARLAISLSCNC